MLHLQLVQVKVYRSADASFVNVPAYVCPKGAHIVTHVLSTKGIYSFPAGVLAVSVQMQQGCKHAVSSQLVTPLLAAGVSAL